MARILAISSQVARGHVGLSIAVPAMQALGHEVIALPTILLSNHPGHPHKAGIIIDPDILGRMFDALRQNGWLTGIDAILTGYLPTAAHAAFARLVVTELRAICPVRPVYLCDPVMGDDPKGLYIDPHAAEAIAGNLVSLADILTPNRFELSYLTGQDIRTPANIFDGLSATRDAHAPVVVATSIPVPGSNGTKAANVLTSPGLQALTEVPLRPHAPHGTGDLFSALFLSAHLAGKPLDQTLAFATAGVDAVLAASASPHGQDELATAALPRNYTGRWSVTLHTPPKAG